MRVCHRDLKLENFVLDKSQSTLKLIDFGLSVVWAEGQTLFKSYGTPCYTAPEIIGGKRYLGPQVDVWSLGVALATMLTGALPFQAIGATELNRRITRGQFHVPEYVSADAKDLLQRMLTTNPEARADLQAMREHAWFKGVGLPRAPPPLQRAPTGGADAAADGDPDAGGLSRGPLPADDDRAHAGRGPAPSRSASCAASGGSSRPPRCGTAQASSATCRATRATRPARAPASAPSARCPPLRPAGSRSGSRPRSS